jgi:predicted dehydrogenase
MGREGKVRFGLIGAGWIGQHHAANITANEHAELAAIADGDAAKAKDFLQRMGSSARVCTSDEELLKQKDLDAVVIATPNAAHARQAIAAAEAGKHIYLEKPMAITLEDCRKVTRAVGKAGVA